MFKMKQVKVFVMNSTNEYKILLLSKEHLKTASSLRTELSTSPYLSGVYMSDLTTQSYLLGSMVTALVTPRTGTDVETKFLKRFFSSSVISTHVGVGTLLNNDFSTHFPNSNQPNGNLVFNFTFALQMN